MCIRDRIITGKILPDGTVAPGVLDGTIASVCGIQTLQMGVFGGIIVGLGVAALHNRYHKIALPNAISFFGGSRFVPILSLIHIFIGDLHSCASLMVLAFSMSIAKLEEMMSRYTG